jgi:CBS domain-containing protein
MYVTLIARHPPALILPMNIRIIDAIKLLSEKNVRHAIISNDGIKINGLLSVKDILRYIRKKSFNILWETIEPIVNKKPIIGKITDEIPNLIKIMAKYDIGVIPIVDEEMKIWGLFSERHLFKLFSDVQTFIRVSEIMSKPLITTDIKSTIDDVVELMLDNDIRRIPIVSKNKLIGIITIKDIIRFMASNYFENIINKELNPFEINALKIASLNPKTISPEVDLSEAVKIMNSNNIGSLIVVHNDKPIGIITERDFILKIPKLNGVEFIIDKKGVIIGRLYF